MAKPILYFHPQIPYMKFELNKGPFSYYIVSTEKIPAQRELRGSIIYPGYYIVNEFEYRVNDFEDEHVELIYISKSFANKKALEDAGYVKATRENLKLYKR